MKFSSKLSNQSGVSVVSLMVGSAVSVIVGLMIATQITEMQRATRVLMQQREVIEIKASLLKVIADPGMCGAQILDQTAIVTTAALEANPALDIFPLGRDRIELIAGQQLVQRNVVSIESATGLRISDIRFTDIKPTGLRDRYIGNLVVSFDPASTLTAIPPITISRSFDVNSLTNAKRCSKGKYEPTLEAVCSLSGQPYVEGSSTCGQASSNGTNYKFTSAGIGGCAAAGAPSPDSGQSPFSLAAEDCLQSSVYQCEDYSCLWVN